MYIMGSKGLVHVFLVSFPGQGHVNPLLRLGKMLASKGLLVTFSTSENIQKRLMHSNNNSIEPAPVGDGFFRFEFFNVGLSNEDPSGEDKFFDEFARVGKEVLPSMAEKYEAKGEPISCFINNPFIPWVSDVAYDLNIPSAMLWVQSCASLSVYHHRLRSVSPFHGAGNSYCGIELPFMPMLKYDEIPSFLQPNSAQGFIRDAILSQLKNYNKPFCVLVNTFYELEAELIDYMSKIYPIRCVGPLIGNNSIATSSNISGSLMKADDCNEWLDSKKEASAVYISFGSVVSLKQEQVIEIAYGLLSAQVNFLWVMRQPHKDYGLPSSFLGEVGDRGKIVKWCSQEKVLSHPSIAFFLTHCGWNSTLEVLSSGVPVLAFPQWGDQVTNAKYLIDVFKVGFRMSRGEAAGLVRREEVDRCLREAMAIDKMTHMKKNALRWKEAAMTAVASGASTERNILEFVKDIKKKNGLY